MVLDGTGSVYDDTGKCLVSISWYCLVLGDTGSARACMPVYWEKWVLPMHDIQTTEYRATQLVYSIKIQLSHATTDISTNTDRWCNRGADRANGE